MKKVLRSGVTLLLVFVLAALTACNGTSEKSDANEQSDKPITIKTLFNWNGSTGPKDMVNNPVAKKIKEKTGVIFNVDHTTGSEVEKINQIFATGSLPDLYIGPAWGDGEEAATLLKAANEGQLYDLTKYINKYPNIAKMVKKENMSPTQYANVISKQKGGQYILIATTPAKKEDIYNWLYGLYVNKDYAARVGIDPQSVHTPQDLYLYLKKVKSLGLKSSGKTVYPLGANGGGWPLEIMSEMFVPVAGAGSWLIDENGNAKVNMMTQEYQDYILYMNKLLREGLLDPQAYSQTTAIAKEKFAQGRDAVIPNQFDGLWTDEHKAGLGNKYVPLGPLNDWQGDPYRTVVKVVGSNAIAVPKTASEEKLDAIMKAINYLASDKGFLLTHYGIEGVHYKKVDGKIKAKKKWVEKQEKDPNTLKNEGINVAYAALSGLDRTYSLAGGPFGYQYSKKSEARKKFIKILTPNGVEPVKGENPQIVLKESDNYEQLQAVFDTLGDAEKQAINASSKEKALSIIKKTRNALKNAGIKEVAEQISKMEKDGKEFMQYRTSN